VWAGEFATSMEMAGLSISVLRLDAELKKLLAAPAVTPFFEQAAIGG
jgi:dihydroxyacetone kinase-like protein